MSETDDHPTLPGTEPAKTTTRLRVQTPWCTSFTSPGKGSDTLVVTREGTDVPSKDAQALIDLAAEHGVTLTEVSET